MRLRRCRPYPDLCQVLKLCDGRGYKKGVRSSRVLARKPPMRPGRYCIRFRRVLTRVVSWLRLRLARLARERLRCDHTSSTGSSSCAYGDTR